MRSYNELKELSENNQNVVLSSLETEILRFLKKEGTPEHISMEDIAEGIELYYNNDTVAFWNPIIKRRLFDVLKSGSPLAKECALVLIREDSEFDKISGLYNLETKELRLKNSDIAKVIDVLNVTFIQSEFDSLRTELLSLDISLNSFVEVTVSRQSLLSYEIRLVENKEQEQRRVESKNRVDSLFSKSVSSTVLLSALLVGVSLFSGNAHSGSIDNLRIPVGDEKVQQAVDKATEAALVQTGAKSVIDKYEGDLKKKVEKTVKEAAGDNLPTLAAIGYAAKVLSDKEITLQQKNLFIKDSSYSLTVAPNKIEVGVKIRFD